MCSAVDPAHLIVQSGEYFGKEKISLHLSQNYVDVSGHAHMKINLFLTWFLLYLP